MEAKRQGAGDVVIGIDVGGSTTKIVGFRRTAAGAPARAVHGGERADSAGY